MRSVSIHNTCQYKQCLSNQGHNPLIQLKMPSASQQAKPRYSYITVIIMKIFSQSLQKALLSLKCDEITRSSRNSHLPSQKHWTRCFKIKKMHTVSLTKLQSNPSTSLNATTFHRKLNYSVEWSAKVSFFIIVTVINGNTGSAWCETFALLI